MKVFLIVVFYLSVGMGLNILIMWIDAKHPEYEIGGLEEGGYFLIFMIFWPVCVVLIGIAFLCGIVGRFAKFMSDCMKEDAEK